MNGRPPRGPLESASDEIPTQILEGGLHDDGPTIVHRDEPTLRAEVNAEELHAMRPASLRALEAAPKLMPKATAPVAPAAPEEDPEPPSIITEIGAVPRMVTMPNIAPMAPMAPIEEGEVEHTKKMAPVYAAPPAVNVVPAAPASEDLPYEVPGLEKSGRRRWLAIVFAIVVCVGIGGGVIGRVSARSKPSTSGTPSATTAAGTHASPALAPVESAASPPDHAPSNVEGIVPAAIASNSPTPLRIASAAPSPVAWTPAHTTVPPPRPIPRAGGTRPAAGAPSGTIVRDNPF